MDRPVSSVMRSEFVSLSVQDRLDMADALMHFGRVRPLPVLDGEQRYLCVGAHPT